MLKFCSCIQFLTDSIYRLTREVILSMDYPAMSRVTMNHIHSKSSTSNTLEMFGLVHTCRVLPNMYTGEPADASGSIKNAVHLLHDCIRLSTGMHLSSDLFKPTKYLENLRKSSKSSWTKFQDGKGRYVWDERVIQSMGEYVILYVKNVFIGQVIVGYAACFHLCKILPLQCRFLAIAGVGYPWPVRGL